MTASEFEREFDILYNNIASNSAPSIDAYEKSVFLTKAQESIVASLYDGSFENSEKLIEYLNDLVVSVCFDSKDSLEVADKYKISTKDNSFMFQLPENVFFIVYESLIKDDQNISVRPTKHDEYNRVRNNPFKRPRKTEALRLISSVETFPTIDNIEKPGLINIPSVEIPPIVEESLIKKITVIEILTSYSEFQYKLRYIRKPKPIILYTEEGLTIDGNDTILNNDSPCELNSALHRIILETAVNLAASTYKQ